MNHFQTQIMISLSPETTVSSEENYQVTGTSAEAPTLRSSSISERTKA